MLSVELDITAVARVCLTFKKFIGLNEFLSEQSTTIRNTATKILKTWLERVMEPKNGNFKLFRPSCTKNNICIRIGAHKRWS